MKFSALKTPSEIAFFKDPNVLFIKTFENFMQKSNSIDASFCE